MTPAEIGASMVRRLLAEIAADRGALRKRSEDVRSFFTARSRSNERAGALALALDRSYTVLESILKRAVRTLEGELPAGPDWHRRLLFDAGLDIELTRPAILGTTTLRAADELRRFRHFLRHDYGADLDLERIDAIAANWLAAVGTIEADLDRFEAFLRDLAERLD